jgi:putative ATP-dependent endonuclease of the OLD family
LDAVRSNLLFAKSVVLVEGDAEEILVPVLVKKVLGVGLDELGISLINIRSTGFKNVAVLFHESRIRKRCAIVTDLDETFFNTAPDPLDTPAMSKAKEKARGARAVGRRRQADLQEFASGNSWISVHFAPHTFEVDFVAAGNASKVVGVLGEIYTDVATLALAKEELESNDIGRFGARALTMASGAGKGWFAIQVARLVDPDTHMPDYLAEAIFTAHRPLSTAVLANMLDYRLGHIRKAELYEPDEIAAMQGQIQAFRAGQVDRGGIRDAMLAYFPADQINAILAHV